MTYEQYSKVNGYSNMYEGWGAEDDDILKRIHQEKYEIIRYPLEISRYDMIKHSADKGNPINSDRDELLSQAVHRYKVDGLSSIEFKMLKTKKK